MMENSLTLSEFQQRLGNSIRLNREIQNVWVRAELSDLRVAGGHCYVELVEKDERGNMRAKLRAMIWSNIFMALRGKFYAATGKDLATGLKVLVKGSATHHNLYGLSFSISDIDPTYTLGDIERLRQEILDRLTKEGLIGRNKELLPPALPQRIAIISAEGAAGYGDFINQLEHNADGFKVYTFLFPAVMQGEKTTQSVLAALDKVEMTRTFWDAVVIIRGGGATTDLNSFDSYELARRVATFPLPVIVGIGHERDRTVLDEIACVRCKTPTAVAEFIVGSLRNSYGHMAETVRRIARYSMEALKGENIRLAALAQAIPAKIHNRLLRHQMKLSEMTSKLSGVTSARLGAERSRLQQYGLKVGASANKNIETQNLRIKRLEDILRILRPENTLKRGYSITRINGKALTKASEANAGDEITTILSDGQITSKVM